MKKGIFKSMMVALGMLLSLYAKAESVEIDGIYYELDSEALTAAVVQNPSGYEGEVVIPQVVSYNEGEYSVTSIGDYAIAGCSGLTSVTIPSSVTCIEGYAIAGCTSLTSITIPENVTSIGTWAFSGCSGLTSVAIPCNVTSIGEGAFAYCSSLGTIQVDAENPVYDSRTNCNAIIETESNSLIAGCKNSSIPEGVEKIADNAFRGCTFLESITIPNGVTYIGFNTFRECSALASLVLPNRVIKIGGYAFCGCSSLTAIEIPEGYESIREWTFSGCSSLVSVTIPSSVTYIDEYAFFGCSNLTSINIPNSVTYIGDHAFQGVGLLNGQEDGMVYIGRVALYKGVMPENTEISIKEGTLGIAASAFSGCLGLTSIIIPNSVESIGNNAFSGCTGLTSLTLPNSIKCISDRVFYDCSELTSIISEIEDPSKIFYYSSNVSSTFEGLPDNCQLIVPNGTRDAYIAAGWTEEIFKGGIVEAAYNLASDNNLEISDAEVCRGKSISIPVDMCNNKPITALQFEVVLPENTTLSECLLTERKGEDHAVSFRQLENGNYQVTVFSLSKATFSGTEGALMNLVIETSQETVADHHPVILKNIELTTEDVKAIRPYNANATLKVSGAKVGDANGDGRISITDAVAIVSYVLESIPNDFVSVAADVNDDGCITITDAVAVIDMILDGNASAKSRKSLADTLDPQ